MISAVTLVASPSLTSGKTAAEDLAHSSDAFSLSEGAAAVRLDSRL